MNIAQEVDHFFDSEKWGAISTIPSDRYLFLQQLVERKGDLKTGYVPYAIIENYGRLVNAFRFWRSAKTPNERKSAGANAIYVAGVMGHYVGDANCIGAGRFTLVGCFCTPPESKGVNQAA